MPILYTVYKPVLCPHSQFATCDSQNTQQYNPIIERLVNVCNSDVGV